MITPVARSALATTLLASAAGGQVVTVIPAAILQNPRAGASVSGDGLAVFGSTPLDGVWGYGRPWIWTAQAGVRYTDLPQGASTGYWLSTSASLDRAVIIGFIGAVDPADGGTFTDPIVVDQNGAAVAAPIVPGRVLSGVSGDGRTFLFGNTTVAAPATFALAGPSGVRIVGAAAPGRYAYAADLSFDGGRVAGVIGDGIGAWNNRVPFMWAGSASAAPISEPAFGQAVLLRDVRLSPDGLTMFGGMTTGEAPNYSDRMYLYSAAHGLELLPDPGFSAWISSVSWDASVLLHNGGGNGQEPVMMLWCRGVGSVPLMDYLAASGVDFAGLSDVTLYNMSYDACTFAGGATVDGVRRPILVTIPAPVTALGFGIGTVAFGRRRR